MAQKSGKYTLNGSVLLSSVLAAIGYTGTNRLSFCSLQNNNATPVYIYLDKQNMTPPSAPSDGLSIGTSEPSISFLINATEDPESWLDAGTTWLNSSAAVTFKITVIGGGV